MERIYTLFRKVVPPEGEPYKLPFQVTAMSDVEALYLGKLRYPNLEVTLSNHTDH